MEKEMNLIESNKKPVNELERSDSNDKLVDSYIQSSINSNLKDYFTQTPTQLPDHIESLFVSGEQLEDGNQNLYGWNERVMAEINKIIINERLNKVLNQEIKECLEPITVSRMPELEINNNNNKCGCIKLGTSMKCQCGPACPICFLKFPNGYPTHEFDSHIDGHFTY
jgi:hypothetical protein